jgi:hypothetical protein
MAELLLTRRTVEYILGTTVTRNTGFRSRAAIFLLIAAGALFGADPLLDRLVSESLRLRTVGAAQDERPTNQLVANSKSALRDWIESRLPTTRAELGSVFPTLVTDINEELKRANLLLQGDSAPGFGYVAEVKISRPLEMKDSIVVIAGVSIPGGTDDSAYVYRFGQDQRRRVFEDDPHTDMDQTISEIRLAPSSNHGSRLILSARIPVPHAPEWSSISYYVYRLPSRLDSAAVPVFSGNHSVNLRFSAPQYSLTHDDLWIDLRDRSFDFTMTRLHIVRYKIGRDGGRRIDPVALLPQDFVEEWLTRPWTEMAARSVFGRRQKLEQWHQTFHSDSLSGAQMFVRQCGRLPGRYQVAIELNSSPVYFVVQEFSEFAFAVEDVSRTRQPGCIREWPGPWKVVVE